MQRAKKVLNAHLEALCKHEVKVKTEWKLPTQMLKVYPNAYTEFLSEGSESSGCHVLVKCLPHYQLTTKLNEQRLAWPKVTKYTNSTEKLLNKKATNPGLGENPIPELPHYIFF